MKSLSQNNRLISDVFRLFEGLMDSLDDAKNSAIDIKNIINAQLTGSDVIRLKAEKASPFGPDFRCANVGGKEYSFRDSQAVCMRILYEAWKNHTPEVGADYILETIGYSYKRLSDLFKGHPAWGTLIVPGHTRGTYRLNIPE